MSVMYTWLCGERHSHMTPHRLEIRSVEKADRGVAAAGAAGVVVVEVVADEELNAERSSGV